MVLIYLIALAAFLGVVYMLWEQRQCYTSHLWPKTNGVIVQSKMSPVKGNRKQRANFIYYRYEVHGKEYYSRRLAMYVVNFFSHEDAARLLAQYPVDKEVTVHYHPIFTRFAVLEPGPRQTGIRMFMLVVFALFLIASLLPILAPGYNPVFELIRTLFK